MPEQTKVPSDASINVCVCVYVCGLPPVTPHPPTHTHTQTQLEGLIGADREASTDATLIKFRRLPFIFLPFFPV